MASVEEEYDIIDEGEIHRIMQEGNQEDDATSQIIVEAETDCIENTAVYAILRLCDIAKPILLDQWREGKLCCPVCLDNQVFYTIPDGLKHHVSVAHHKRVSDDLLQDAKRISRASVCQDTLENIMKLSSARQHADPFGRLYMKCVVTSDGEQEVVKNATREKEAAKLYCLYLQQMGKLSNIKEREKFCPVSLKSQKLEIKFMAWTSSSKIHLETCFSRMIDTLQPELGGLQLESVPSQVSYQDVVNLSAEEQPLFVLQKIFGHEAFRQGQKETIDNILAGNDNIALLPTGGGKSIIYSVAAIIQGGIHIVVEPLKSLMEEQVRSLRGKNVVSYFVNNSVTEAQKDEIINIITNPSTQYALLLTSPEQLQGVKLQNALDLLKKQGRLINCFVDEAHCVDLWSGSSRSAYSKLGFLKNKIGIPVTALSGSATDQTVSAIQKSLSMSENTLITRMSFSRENLSISILKKSTKPYYQIANLIKNDYPDSCGIVYCNKRITTKELAHELRCQGISATFIHGGLNDTERRSSEKKWKEEIVKVACCTKTFGMGIDKRNVRFVFHVDMPESYEDYYQEIGRAGRDQEPAVAMSLLSPGDRNFHLQNISRISDKEEREFKLKNLYHISKMFLQTIICRHSLIMKHFGETIPSCEERCDICCGIQKNTELDCIKEARVVMKCITDMKRISSKVTMNLLLLTLMGSNAQEVKIKGFDAVEHHGAAKKFDVGTYKKKDRKLFLQKIVLELIFQQFILETFKEKEVRGRKIQETNCQERIVYLELGNLAEFYLLKKLIVS